MVDQPKPKADLVPVEPGTSVPLKPKDIAAAQRQADLKRRVDMIADNDSRIVHGVSKFKDIPGPTEPGYQEVLRVLNEGTAQDLADLGFPGGIARGRKALRLALWGQARKADAPYGIIAANERHQARLKIQGKQGGSSTVNVNMINIPAPRPAGPDQRVIVIQPKDDEK